MEYVAWAPYYDQIRAEFGFDLAAEAAAAQELRDLLPPAALERPIERIAERLAGRDVIVVGCAPGTGPPPIWTLRATERPAAIVAADGATSTCLAGGLVPDVISTDLDGPVASEVTANQRGSLVVVHAHGDNRRSLAEWVPHFSGALAGSWAGPPESGIIDVGGFTDGDRAACLAEHVRAHRIVLWGFDFHRVDEPDESRAARKRAKLRWAETVIGLLAARGEVPIFTWRRDGTLERYPSDNAVESTK